MARNSKIQSPPTKRVPDPSPTRFSRDAQRSALPVDSPSKRPPIRTVAFVSLGCPKNLVDSERMLGLLAQDGLAITANAAEADYKTLLQEKLQAERRSPPRYAVVEMAGPPHKRVFHVELVWHGGCVRAQGRSIKAAEAAAAQQALESMRSDSA